MITRLVFSLLLYKLIANAVMVFS